MKVASLANAGGVLCHRKIKLSLDIMGNRESYISNGQKEAPTQDGRA